MHDKINKTKLNRFKNLVEHNKKFIDSRDKENSDDKKFSIAISMSVLMEYIGLNQLKAYKSITEGGDDNKIDAFYYSDDENELGELIIIQSKYKQDYGATGSFTDDDIKLCIDSCNVILDGNNFQKCNPKLNEGIETFRKILRENGNPKVTIRLFFCTNGLISEVHKNLTEVKEACINNIECNFIDVTNFGLNRKAESGELVINLKNSKDRTDSVFNISDANFSGLIGSTSIENLMNFYEHGGERLLLNSNVRYLIKRSNINKEITKSFIEDPKKFVYLNNGISIICEAYTENRSADGTTKIFLTNPSIINGGQTIANLYELKKNKYEELKTNFQDAKILIRCYKVPEEYSINIATATNSQNPISLVDLKSNDHNQKKAKDYFEKEGVGLITKKGEELSFYNDTITNEYLLQVYAALYGDEPGKAKVSKAGIFKNYYEKVFTDNMDEEILKKLFRCYSIQRFIEGNFLEEDKVLITNGIFSIIYTMNKHSPNIQNQNIPEATIERKYKEAYDKSLITLKKIVKEKTEKLKDKFSMNNLFKGSEIKDLIDVELGL